MSDHEPECPHDGECVCSHPLCDHCICVRLRACEARVRWDTSNTLTAAHLQSEREWADLSRGNYDAGYAAALDAARNAVAGMAEGGLVLVVDALAAIDVLRGAE